MTVAYPGKLNKSMSVRDIFKQFVLSDREIHLITSTAIAKINNIAAKTIPILGQSSMINRKNLKKAP